MCRGSFNSAERLSLAVTARDFRVRGRRNVQDQHSDDLPGPDGGPGDSDAGQCYILVHTITCITYYYTYYIHLHTLHIITLYYMLYIVLHSLHIFTQYYMHYMLYIVLHTITFIT